jgi:hypothetical protein
MIQPFWRKLGNLKGYTPEWAFTPPVQVTPFATWKSCLKDFAAYEKEITAMREGCDSGIGSFSAMFRLQSISNPEKR